MICGNCFKLNHKTTKFNSIFVGEMTELCPFCLRDYLNDLDVQSQSRINFYEIAGAVIDELLRIARALNFVEELRTVAETPVKNEGYLSDEVLEELRSHPDQMKTMHDSLKFMTPELWKKIQEKAKKTGKKKADAYLVSVGLKPHAKQTVKKSKPRTKKKVTSR